MLLDKYLRVECLGHIIGICLTFPKTDKLFSTEVVLFYMLTSIENSSSSIFLQILGVAGINFGVIFQLSSIHSNTKFM